MATFTIDRITGEVTGTRSAEEDSGARWPRQPSVAGPGPEPAPD